MRKLRQSTVNTTGHKGNTKHPLYCLWKSMITRCYYLSHAEYIRYGALGIQVHTSWLNFNNFVKDMGDRPAPHYQLDRIDPKGNYQPDNCRWVTPSQNTTNSRPRNGKKYKGVYFNKKQNSIFASITLNGKSKFIGTFLSEEEAARAYNEYAVRIYGEFARLNEVEE